MLQKHCSNIAGSSAVASNVSEITMSAISVSGIAFAACVTDCIAASDAWNIAASVPVVTYISDSASVDANCVANVVASCKYCCKWWKRCCYKWCCKNYTCKYVAQHFYL